MTRTESLQTSMIPQAGGASWDAVVRLTITTVLFSIVPALVRVISLSSLQMVSGRAMTGAIAVILALLVRRHNPFIVQSWRHLPILLVLGAMVGCNWLLYIASIQAAGIAVAVVSLFTYPLLTALIEPFVSGDDHHAIEVVAALAVVGGVALVVPHWKVSDSVFQGVTLGVLSACCVAGFGITSRRLLRTYSVSSILFYQFTVPALMFLPWFPWKKTVQASPVDWLTLGKLAVMGILLTAVPQMLFMGSLKKIRMTVAALLLSLQPLYTVLLGWMFIGASERPAARTAIGGLVITAAVLVVTLAHARANASSKSEMGVVEIPVE